MVVAAPIVGATKPHHLTDASLRSTCIRLDEGIVV